MRSKIGLAVVIVGFVATVVFARGAEGTAWSLLPPLLAISLALVLRDVLVSLAVGIWLGATMVAGGNPAAGFLRLVDTYVRDALSDPDHVSIIVFSMLLGGMVGVMSKSGGTLGVVRALEPLARTPRRAQVLTWLMGMTIFFDDYSNTLIVGNTMRPVTDRHQVSREKLAFLVDSTAAPVACVALVSTWIGYQVSLLSDAFLAAGSSFNPFAVFVSSIPFAFYPLFVLAMTLASAAMARDWGPMLAAEKRARRGELLSGQAQPLADYESSGLAPEEGIPCRWFNAALPVLIVIGATLVGLYVTGMRALQEAGLADRSLRAVLDNTDSFTALLWASLIGLTSAIVLAVGQKVLSLRSALEATVSGFKSMLMAFVVLTLAWSLGQVCTDLATGSFLKSIVEAHMATALIPTAVFLTAAAVSFATGTSWGTMAILTPLAVPLVLEAGRGEPALVAATVSAILGGSVFGDHCSPISDTTILSSMASSCDHVDHVRTQLPYAMVGGLMAMICGYLPAAFFGWSPWFLLVAGWVVMFAIMRFAGQQVDSPCSPAESESANGRELG